MNLKLSINTNMCNVCVIFIVFYILFIGFFTYKFGVPESFFYLPDIIVIIVFFKIIPSVTKALKYANILFPFLIAFLFFLVGTITAVFNSFNFFQWIWALRNWLRFFLFFLICLYVLDKNMIDFFLKKFIIIFHINFFVILFEFIFFGVYGDYANGIIGRDTSSVNLVFILIITSYAIASLHSKKISIIPFLVLVIEIFILNIICELKGNFVFFLVLSISLYFFNLKYNLNNFLKFFSLCFFALLVFYTGLLVLSKVYPIFENIASFDGFIRILDSGHGYGNIGYYDRLNGISVTNKYFFKDDLLCKLFGYGLGNAEYSAFDFLKSEFYLKNGSEFQYLNFSLSVIYIECGFVGVFLIYLFNCLLLKKLHYALKIQSIDSFYINLGIAFIIISLIFIFYNNLHRTDSSYLIAFMIAIPFSLISKSIRRVYEKN